MDVVRQAQDDVDMDVGTRDRPTQERHRGSARARPPLHPFRDPARVFDDPLASAHAVWRCRLIAARIQLAPEGPHRNQSQRYTRGLTA